MKPTSEWKAGASCRHPSGFPPSVPAGVDTSVGPTPREADPETSPGSAQEFDGVRILGRFRQIVIFQPDCRHALAFSSRYRRFL